jgi:signal transduction histidine kinase
MGHAELLLEERGSLPPDLQKRLEVIHRGCARIRDVVRRLEGLRDDRTVEYLPGMNMIDLHGEKAGEGDPPDS